MGNPDKRRKRSKTKAKANRANKNPSSNDHNFESIDFSHINEHELDELELTEEIEAFFKTLPPFTPECKAVPLIKQFVEVQGNTPSDDVINHVRELLALFAHWSDGVPLHYPSIEDLIITFGESAEFEMAFKQSEKNILDH
jgi:hypothetical protein